MRGKRRKAADDAFARLGQARAEYILDERTRRLAARGGDEAARRPTVTRLVFAVGANLYGLPLDSVTRIRRSDRVGVAPSSAAAVLGLTGDAGRVVTVLDLATLLGAAAPAAGEDYLLVLAPPRDAALRVATLPVATETAPVDNEPQHARVAEAGALSGRTVTLLDLERLLPAARPASVTAGA
jgi:chemotaxis signal transduction protein